MRDVLLHAHIFKNAGTTLDWSLARAFEQHFFEHRDDASMRAEPDTVLQSLLDEGASLRALSSHSMPCPAPELDGFNFTTLLMLRHPLRRVRSVYDFERRQKADTPGAIAAKKMSYAEYVAWRMLPTTGPTIRNFQTRYLSGGVGRQPGAVVGQEHLNRAMEIVNDSLGVGIVERYDESMVLFEYQLKDRFPELDLAYLPQNVSKKVLGKTRTWFADLGDSHDAVIDGNAIDLALYHAANQRLDQRIAAVDGFQDKVDEFRARCTALA